MKTIINLLFSLAMIFLLLQIKITKAKTNLFINLVSHRNIEHRLSSGRCCDQGIEKNCTRDWKNHNGGCEICTLECDYFFVIDLLQTIDYNNNTSENVTNVGNNSQQQTHKSIKSDVLSYVDNFEFKNKINNETLNPLVYNVELYKGTFKLDIASFDEDEGGNDTVDFISQSFTARDLSIGRYSHTRPFNFTVNGTVSSIHIQIWASCLPDYYNVDCSTYCKKQNNSYGHYRCDGRTGYKVCLPGWSDPTTNCTTKVQMNCSTLLNTKAKGQFEKINKTEFISKFHYLLQEMLNYCRDDSFPATVEISIYENYFNFSTTSVALNTSITYKSCFCSEKKFDNCMQNALYKSPQLINLQMTEVNICLRSSSSCDQNYKAVLRKQIKVNRKVNKRDILVGVVISMVALVVIISVIFYMKKKRKAKIDDASKNESSLNKDSTDSETSKF